MKKEIKIIHVENKVCAVLPTKLFSYVISEPEKFIDFVQGLREDFPQFKLHCVIDKKLENKVKARLHPQGAFIRKGKENGR